MDTTTIVWSVFVSALGMAYMSFGKTQKRMIPLLGGVVMMVLPYFGYSLFVAVGITLLIVGLSYMVKI